MDYFDELPCIDNSRTMYVQLTWNRLATTSTTMWLIYIFPSLNRIYQAWATNAKTCYLEIKSFAVLFFLYEISCQWDESSWVDVYIMCIFSESTSEKISIKTIDQREKKLPFAVALSYTLMHSVPVQSVAIPGIGWPLSFSPLLLSPSAR